MTDATLDRKNNGHVLIRCGVCRAVLGEEWPPNPKGYAVLDAYARMVAEDSGYPPVDTTVEWMLTAPLNRKISVAMGFSRDVQRDGGIIYRIIRPKPKRDALGGKVLDERGQPLMREGSGKPK